MNDFWQWLWAVRGGEDSYSVGWTIVAIAIFIALVWYIATAQERHAND